MCRELSKEYKIITLLKGRNTIISDENGNVYINSTGNDALAKAGSGLGSGAVIVMDETTCMVKACTRISRFYHMESCGQCTPCREGTGWMHRVLQRIVDGKGKQEDLELLKSAAGQIEGHTICAFGEAAAWPVQGFLRHYWHEFEYYVEHGRSMVDAQEGKAA